MAAETKFFDELGRVLKLSIHTFAPARVLSFNYSKQEADIELLFMSNSGGVLEKIPMIPGVPVLSMRYRIEESNGTSYTRTYKSDLRAGDVVFVAFCERAIDNLSSQPFDPEYRRTHDYRDAVIIGGWGL